MSISISFEELVASTPGDGEANYDCLIIGSGYGGAVAARTFSRCKRADGKPLKIAVLERGKEYLPGSFPAGLNEVIGTINRTGNFESVDNAGDNDWSLPHDGLYDIRTSESHWIMSGNGVGGGSLVNAGVMLAPDSNTLEDAAWPEEARTVLSDTDFMNSVGLMLGSRLPDAESGSIANTVEHASVETNKYRAIASLGGSTCAVSATPLSIRLSKDEPDQAIVTSPCIKCGNCFSGCNFNAKKSLDTNLLAEAQHNGVTVVNGAETLFFEKHNNGWAVHVVYSSAKLRTTLNEPLKLNCDHLVIAAGSVGSTELLLRSQYKAIRNEGASLFSEALGKRFFGNGDTISAMTDRSQPVTMIANDATHDETREIGPTNSGMLDFRHVPEHRFVLQELAVPGALQRAFIELISFTRVRDALTSLKCGLTGSSAKFLGLTESNVDHTIVIAGIGGDRSEGTISEQVREKSNKPVSAAFYSQWLPCSVISFSSNAADTSWKKHRDKVLNQLSDLGSKNDNGSTVVENPMENPFGNKINKMFNMSAEKSSDTNGLLMSVHPLGGCGMADSAESGVVNTHGQVFKSEAKRDAASNITEVYDNLAVLDGAIVPSPVDVNPALTISALALNASTNLARKWGWEPVSLTEPKPTKRKFVRKITPEHRNSIKPTGLTLAERLVGSVCLDAGNGPDIYIAELRLRSETFHIDQFAKGEPLTIELLNEPSQDCAGKLPLMSELRLFRKVDWDSFLVAEGILDRREQMIAAGLKDQWMKEQRLMLGDASAQLDKLAVLTVPLSGSIYLMDEVKTNAISRLVCGAFTWFFNRGLRDIWHSRQMIGKGATNLKAFLRYAPSVFLHSGRERQFRYELKTGSPSKCELSGGDQSRWAEKPIRGFKHFFYGMHSNPINQLTSIELSDFPMLDGSQSKTLSVDLEYFADVQIPLFQIDEESDAVTGNADLIAFATWISRISFLHYFWLLRKPDKPSEFPETMRPDPPNTEPKSLPGLAAEVEVISLMVADPNNKYDGKTFIRLSRFKDGEPNPSLAPVLCIHGFSLSWSMFAHETLYGGVDEIDGATLKGGLAAYLARKGHDVWVVDLRSSGSLPTARVDWEFEEAALIDIPVALEYISKNTGSSTVNVVSHCMGAMKFSMLMMCSDTNFKRYNKVQNLDETRQRIGRIVLSQAGPFVRFSPANRLRERIIGVVKNLANFDLQFEENPDASDSEEVLDRALNIMPYPEHELRIENPKFAKRFWVRGRHRMDALYGKTFSLKNMDLSVLERFHDFFGPLSFRMLEQVIWFSRRNQISDTYGGDYKLQLSELRRHWQQDTLWIHGEENELLDPISAILTTLIFDESKADNFKVQILKNFGHQDCMMGKNCELPYGLINDHFNKASVT